MGSEASPGGKDSALSFIRTELRAVSLGRGMRSPWDGMNGRRTEGQDQHSSPGCATHLFKQCRAAELKANLPTD